MRLAAMPHSTSLADLPPEIVGQILAAAVHGMRMDYLNILASDARDHDKYWHDLLPYLQLRGVCSGWRSLLGSLPLPVEHVDVRSAKNLYDVEAAPLRIGHLHVWVRPEEIETAVDALASVVASRRFQRHSGASLRLISAPAFTFPADSAAAFRQLTGIGRLNSRNLPQHLPAGLEDLVLEGDGQQLTRLPSEIIGTCTQLRRLALFNMTVEAEQLPRSLSALDLVNVELGPVLSKALRDFTQRMNQYEARHIWKGPPERRLVSSCCLKPEWDSSGGFVVRNAFNGHNSLYSTDTSPHAAYMVMYEECS